MFNILPVEETQQNAPHYEVLLLQALVWSTLEKLGQIPEVFADEITSSREGGWCSSWTQRCGFLALLRCQLCIFSALLYS